MASKDLVFTVLGIDKASRTFDKVGNSMDRMGNRAVKALTGVEGSSVAAAGAVAGAVGGLPVLFAAVGAAAVSSNQEVQDSFSALSQQIESGLMQDAQPLEQAFVSAAEEISAAYSAMRPEMRDAFAASVPHVETLTDGVLSFAENAMPGMVTSVERAGPVMDGLAVTMADAGTGVSEFFRIVSSGSEEAGQGIVHLGTLVEGTLPEMGGILVNLTGMWATHGDEVVAVVTRITGVINDLSGHALPVVSSALGVTLDVLTGVLNVVEPMAGMLGPAIGAWLSLAAAMRGMRAVRGVISGVSDSVLDMQTRMSDAAGKRGMGRLAVASRGVMGLFGGPWGLAIAGATAALALFGQNSQESAQDQRDLASALRESGGAFDANARRAVFNSQQYQEISEAVEKAGLEHSRFIDTLVDGGPAFERLRQQLQKQVEAGRELVQGQYASRVSYTASAAAAKKLLDQMGGLRSTVQGAAKDFRTEERAARSAAEQMVGSVPGATALEEAMQTLKDTTAATADRADALNTAWRQLFGIEISLREATLEWEEGMDQLRKSMQQATTGAGNWRNTLFTASGAINQTTDAGQALERNLIEQGKQYKTLAQTAYDTALRQGKSQQEATQAAIAATRKRRAQFVREAQSMGFTADRARELANQYFGIPENVSTLVTTPGAAEAIGAAHRVQGALAGIDPYKRVVVDFDVTGDRARAGYGGYMRRAHGGAVASQRPYLVGEDGPELIVPQAPATVLPNRKTEQAVSTSGRSGGFGERSMVHIDTLVTAPHQTPQDIAVELDWYSRGGG